LAENELCIIVMRIFEVDFYTGFEPDPELIFIWKSIEAEKRFKLWEGYFDTIMQQSYISKDSGSWQGLAYYYHLLPFRHKIIEI
jgi:hypothetical protein